MAKKDFKKEDAQLENVSEALSTTGQWIEEHSKKITYVLTGIIVVVLGIIAIYNYVIKPKALEASNETAKAVAYFMQGDYQKALLGDEADCMGFEAIADDYSMYQQGELAALYAGICHYELGEFAEAADYLLRVQDKRKAIKPDTVIIFSLLLWLCGLVMYSRYILRYEPNLLPKSAWVMLMCKWTS